MESKELTEKVNKIVNTRMQFIAAEVAVHSCMTLKEDFGFTPEKINHFMSRFKDRVEDNGKPKGGE